VERAVHGAAAYYLCMPTCAVRCACRAGSCCMTMYSKKACVLVLLDMPQRSQGMGGANKDISVPLSVVSTVFGVMSRLLTVLNTAMPLLYLLLSLMPWSNQGCLEG
jgi:hypothetical protein